MTTTKDIEKKKYFSTVLEQWWPAKCPACGWRGISRDCGGGAPIADTGDFTDPICPKCLEKEKGICVEDDPDFESVETTLSSSEREILEHTLGIGEGGDRNYFSAGPNHSDQPILDSLYEKGLMSFRKSPFTKNDRVYHVTSAGRGILKKVAT